MVILKRKYTIKKKQKKWIELTYDPRNDIRIKYRKIIKKKNYKI